MADLPMNGTGSPTNNLKGALRGPYYSMAACGLAFLNLTSRTHLAAARTTTAYFPEPLRAGWGGIIVPREDEGRNVDCMVD